MAATTDTKALQKYTAEERERNARILRERISPAFEASETVGLMIKPRGRESVADDTDALEATDVRGDDQVGVGGGGPVREIEREEPAERCVREQ